LLARSKILDRSSNTLALKSLNAATVEASFPVSSESSEKDSKFRPPNGDLRPLIYADTTVGPSKQMTALPFLSLQQAQLQFALLCPGPTQQQGMSMLGSRPP